VTLHRTATLSVRVSEEELRMLQALAEALGVSASDVVRMYIREAHARRDGKPPG
jgi:antitoxin component of RelBE/YafQ-DinJ toxin-antitoxin module